MKKTEKRIHGLREKRLVALLRKKKKKLALAESCTGGDISGRLTDIPGSSDVFKGAVVAYSNDIKTSVLGVPAGIIKRHGAVSEQTAVAMARGARLILRSDIAASITGIAGPSGGREGKPVGLAHIAVVSGRKVLHKKVVFKGARKRLKKRFSEAVLDLLLENI